MKFHLPVCCAVVLMTLAIGGCGNSSHPASSVLRVGILMATTVRLERTCKPRLGRFCSFEELPLAELQRWGDLRLESPTLATFEEFDLQIFVDRDHFCMVSFPSRFPMKISAEWRGSDGKSHITAYPWREIPKACEMQGMAKLRIER